MKTRTITIVLTFLAGLYFILDFVVPPTVPLISAHGVVTGATVASFSVQTGRQPPVAYRLAGPPETRPQIMVSQRDILGNPTLAAIPLRKLGVGSIVTIRIGPIIAKQAIPGTVPTVETMSGQTIALAPGQEWVNAANDAPVASPLPGTSLFIEQPDARIIEVHRGSVELMAGGQRSVHPIRAGAVLMKAARYGSGTEVQADELRVGDTVTLGPATTFADNRDAAAQFNLVLTTMAFGIGLVSLGMVNSTAILKRQSGWYLSVFFFAAVILGLVAGFGKYDEPQTSARAFSDFVVLRLISAVTSAVFSILAFYMASAAYRAFRVRNAEAALMMASALIVMVGQTPFGSYLSSWMGERYSALWLPNIAAWILRVPNTAVFRGLVFGIMLGAMATALRYWLSMERSITSGK